MFWLILGGKRTVESNYYGFFFPNQPVGVSRLAQSVLASHATDGVIKFVNLIRNVVATRHAHSPKTLLTCAFQTTQVFGHFYCVCMCICVYFCISSMQVTTFFFPVTVIGSITLEGQQYYPCLSEKKSQFELCNNKLLEEVKKILMNKKHIA